jgi:predicted ATP-grasp superfamily ATP-dependent carboligase
VACTCRLIAVRVLILDGHCRAALESAQSLGRRGAEIDLACETEDCLAFRSRYVANRLVQPASNAAPGAVEWLVGRHAERNYDLIIPSTDVALQLLRALDETHPARVRAVLPGNRSLDVALDKVETHRLAQALGIPVPRATTIPQGGAIPERSNFPVVLKSRRSRVIMDGTNCRLEAVIARDAAERERVLCFWQLKQDFVSAVASESKCVRPDALVLRKSAFMKIVWGWMNTPIAPRRAADG